MVVYLAASWSRKDEIRLIADELNVFPNLVVKARWLFEVPPKIYDDEFRRQRAEMDVEDVQYADVLIRFSDDLNREMVPAYLATGARMFEMGFAYAQGKQIIVVGGHQPIFDYLSNIKHVSSVEELKEFLKKLTQHKLNEISYGAVRHG